MVPAYPGGPGQGPESRKTVVVVVVGIASQMSPGCGPNIFNKLMRKFEVVVEVEV